MLFEGPFCRVGKSYTAAALGRFRRAYLTVKDRALHSEHPRLKINISPLQPQNFTLAHPRSDCQHVEGVQLGFFRHGQ
jgi:hypothetical protein